MALGRVRVVAHSRSSQVKFSSFARYHLNAIKKKTVVKAL